ncbi:hypothetical protein [Candidatus Lokiarchaeum ossiferum]|uniref:hypothetical protein n=1 Tax=Candidatus Lokiarchaeum ossiferum TaxID=2951803 RepID=UPI00352FC064
MSKESNSAGTIIASKLITLVITGTRMYFGFPLIFPNMTSDLSEYARADDLPTIRLQLWEI